MDWLVVLAQYLPPLWITALHRVPPQQRALVQEIRLRVGQPVTVSLPTGDRYLSADGLCGMLQRGVAMCSQEQLDACFLRFCEESVYAHETELRQGFIAVAGGIRVGVAGTAAGHTVRQITSLCVRLPRRHNGCAAPLLPYIEEDDQLHSAILVGAPSSGKTTLLRDIAVTLAAHRWRVAVVDERGELAGIDGLIGCDVLRHYPKPLGVRQAIRTLAPQAVIFDELGEEAEIQAVAECANAGVAVIASLHGDSPDTVAGRHTVRALVAGGVFDNWLFLAGRRTPGRCVGAYRAEVTEDAIHWYAVSSGGGCRARSVLCTASASAHRLSATVDAPHRNDGTTDTLCGTAAGNAVAWVRRG